MLSLFVWELHLLWILDAKPFLPNNRSIQDPATGALDDINGPHIGDGLARALINVACCFCACASELTNKEKPTAENMQQQFLVCHLSVPFPDRMIAAIAAFSGSDRPDQPLMTSINSELSRSFCASICVSGAVSV